MKNQNNNSHSPHPFTNQYGNSLTDNNPHNDGKQSPSSTNSQYNYPHLFKTAYGLKSRESMSFPATGFGRTKQAFAAECDINNIMARYQRTGVIDFAQKNAAQYGDCTGIEFQAGMETVRKAQELFDALPSKLRSRFQNEPAQFLEFVQNPENAEEARELGLVNPKPPEATPLATPSGKAQQEAPLDRGAVRKAAQKAADTKEAGLDQDQFLT